MCKSIIITSISEQMETTFVVQGLHMKLDFNNKTEFKVCICLAINRKFIYFIVNTITACLIAASQ